MNNEWNPMCTCFAVGALTLLPTLFNGLLNLNDVNV